MERKRKLRYSEKHWNIHYYRENGKSYLLYNLSFFRYCVKCFSSVYSFSRHHITCTVFYKLRHRHISYLPALKQLLKPYKSLCALVLWSKNFLLETPRHPLSLKSLAEELLIRKWDDVKAKCNCWTGKLITI